jgi:hypothetical protein
MEKTEQINQKVIELWKWRFADNDDVRMPLIYPTLNPSKISVLLFIGLNPSFGERWSMLKATGAKLTYMQANGFRALKPLAPNVFPDRDNIHPGDGESDATLLGVFQLFAAIGALGRNLRVALAAVVGANHRRIRRSQ